MSVLKEVENKLWYGRGKDKNLARKLVEEFSAIKVKLDNPNKKNVLLGAEVTRLETENDKLASKNEKIIAELEWMTSLDLVHFDHPAAMFQEKDEEVLAEIAKLGDLR